MRIRALLAATNVGGRILACLSRVETFEATSSSWRECLDIFKSYTFLSYKKTAFRSMRNAIYLQGKSYKFVTDLNLHLLMEQALFYISLCMKSK